MSAVTGEIHQYLQTQWAAALKRVLVSMTSEAFDIQEQKEPERTGEGWTWYSQTLNVSQSATIWVGAANETWTALGKSMLMALGLEEPSDADIESTCTDIVAQSNGALAQEL